MPTYERGRRPENVGRLLSATSFGDALHERIGDRQTMAERSGSSISSVSALAHLFIETGSRYIEAVYDELPPGAVHLHPYMSGIDQLSDPDERNRVKQAFLAVAIGASVLALEDMMHRGAFNRALFVSLYNENMRKTALPSLTLRDIPLQSTTPVNEDGHEIIDDFAWVKLDQRYKEAGFADFLGSDLWGSLPPSLQAFFRLQGEMNGISYDVQTLFAEFSLRAKALIAQERETEAMQQQAVAQIAQIQAASFRRTASMFINADFGGVSLDPDDLSSNNQ